MSSIIEGYSYDIFISYRQNDNKYDGWVTEFVDNLNKELEATIKDKISVYFDINPHDGLLETHSVDRSLEEKLKCLIFIPVISQTYCDSKSFAWQHELCAFNKLAKEDKFGRDIKLIGGNVASRILPVKIHDLDPDDKTLLENELGGILRSIEFIYNSAGVNRPLNPLDNPDKNLNKTYYRDQINKVAHAIKEIITALKKQSQHKEEVSKQDFEVKSTPQKNLRVKTIVGTSIILALIVIGYLYIPKLFKSEKQIEKSIAVLPFRNLSNDTTQLYFCDGFTEEILNNLQKVNSFTVRSRTSTDQYRDTKKLIKVIGKELNVNYLVEGSVGREGNSIKIWIQLIDSKADKHVWSKDYAREMEHIFTLQSEIAKDIAAELKAVLSPDEIEEIEKRPTKNLEAYNYYLQGNYFKQRTVSQDYITAISLYEKAIELDPKFTLAYTQIAESLLGQYWFYNDRSEGLLQKCKQIIDKAFEIDPELPEVHLALGIYYYQGYLRYSQALEQFEIVLKDQPKNSEAIFWSGAVHRREGKWEMAKSEFLKALELNPRTSDYAFTVGETFDLLRDYSKAEQYYNMTIILQPDMVSAYINLSLIFLKGKGDIEKARGILENESSNIKTLVSNSTIIETEIMIDIYDGKFEEALKDLSLLKSNAFQNQFSFRPKYLYYAHIYGLMNKPELEHSYYDSTRILLEKKIIDFPEDQRFYSTLGIVYAGLGFEEKAIVTSEKAVKMLPVRKEAWKGVYLVEDIAYTYVLLGKYSDALKQIDYLLSIPGPLSFKIIEMDPRWALLRNQPKFNKMLEKYSNK